MKQSGMRRSKCIKNTNWNFYSAVSCRLFHIQNNANVWSNALNTNINKLYLLEDQQQDLQGLSSLSRSKKVESNAFFK